MKNDCGTESSGFTSNKAHRDKTGGWRKTIKRGECVCVWLTKEKDGDRALVRHEGNLKCSVWKSSQFQSDSCLPQICSFKGLLGLQGLLSAVSGVSSGTTGRPGKGYVWFVPIYTPTSGAFQSYQLTVTRFPHFSTLFFCTFTSFFIISLCKKCLSNSLSSLLLMPEWRKENVFSCFACIYLLGSVRQC